MYFYETDGGPLFLTSVVLHQVIQLLGMLQKLQPPGILTLAPAAHRLSCSAVSTISRQLEKYCSEPTFTYTLTHGGLFINMQPFYR